MATWFWTSSRRRPGFDPGVEHKNINRDGNALFDNPNSWGLFIVFLNFTQSNPRVMSPDRKEISLIRASRWSRPFLIFHPPEKSASSILLSRFFLHIGCRYGVSPQISFFNGMKVSYNRNNHRLCDTSLKSLVWQKSSKGWSNSSEIVFEVISCWILQSVMNWVHYL